MLMRKCIKVVKNVGNLYYFVLEFFLMLLKLEKFKILYFY